MCGFKLNIFTPVGPKLARAVIIRQAFKVTIFGGYLTPQLCVLNEEYLVGGELTQTGQV